MSARGYTIGQLARIAGVSVRTLHHYDQIGLLKPAGRTGAGYRVYGHPSLLRLQQILFFKELDLPLDEIRQILDDPGFDQMAALAQHRQAIQARMDRLARLLTTIDRTIDSIGEDALGLTDEELYEGFTKEEIEAYKQEARQRFDPKLVAETERKVKNMSRDKWDGIRAEGEVVNRTLAALADHDPASDQVQAAVARHHAWIESFYPCPAETYQGLGQMYAQDDRFRAYYDKYRPGLADFLAEAMAAYACDVLSKR